MSTDVRQEIADAASTVEQITCTPYHQQTTSPGAAVVRYGSTAYPNRFGGITTWEVVVVLPQNVAQAETFIEAIKRPLVDAIAPTMTVRRAYPATSILGGSQTNVLVIEGTREDEE